MAEASSTPICIKMQPSAARARTPLRRHHGTPTPSPSKITTTTTITTPHICTVTTTSSQNDTTTTTTTTTAAIASSQESDDDFWSPDPPSPRQPQLDDLAIIFRLETEVKRTGEPDPFVDALHAFQRGCQYLVYCDGTYSWPPDNEINRARAVPNDTPYGKYYVVFFGKYRGVYRCW